MKLEDCKLCEYHYKSQLDDILCEFSGGFAYRVIAQDKKGNAMVVMCPMENQLPNKNTTIVAENMKFLVNIS